MLSCRVFGKWNFKISVFAENFSQASEIQIGEFAARVCGAVPAVWLLARLMVWIWVPALSEDHSVSAEPMGCTRFGYPMLSTGSFARLAANAVPISGQASTGISRARSRGAIVRGVCVHQACLFWF